MIDYKFERIGRTAQRGTKEGRSEIQNQLPKQRKQFHGRKRQVSNNLGELFWQKE
jgi:hypothetical protein